MMRSGLSSCALAMASAPLSTSKISQDPAPSRRWRKAFLTDGLSSAIRIRMGMRIGKLDGWRPRSCLSQQRWMPYELTTNHSLRNTANFVYPTVRYPNVSDIERGVRRHPAASNFRSQFNEE